MTTPSSGLVAPAAPARTPAPGMKFCTSCGTEIYELATVCHNCKASQQPFREELRYWAGLTGLATLILSGLAFSAAFLLAAFRFLFLPDIAVSELDTQGDSVIWNQSGRKIWVDTFKATSVKPYFDLEVQVHKAITEVEVPYSFSFANLAGCQWQGTNADLFDTRGVGDYTAKLSDADFDAKIKKDPMDNHYMPVILFKKGAEYKQLIASGTAISEMPFTCSFQYTRLDLGTSGTQTVDCVGVLKNHIPGPPGATGVCNRPG